jgi:hypothetical protein
VTSLPHASPARLVVGNDRHRDVEGIAHRRLEEERNFDHPELRLRVERAPPGRDPLSNPGVKLGLQPGQLLGLLKDDLPHPPPVDPAGRGDLRSPALDQALAHLLGVEQLVNDRIAGDGLSAEPPQGCQRL